LEHSVHTRQVTGSNPVSATNKKFKPPKLFGGFFDFCLNQIRQLMITRRLRVFMANIRRKIDNDRPGRRLITTEVGVGYNFSENAG
ncbi:MAG TPA: hypothetical protein DCM41_05155, partial [Synergistaceae bacterium]|nr:hypothetical protein [Synergistaceae bacterium]